MPPRLSFPQDAIAICRRVAARQRDAGQTSPTLLLANSGGKDAISIAAPAYENQCFDRIEGFYMYLVRDLECVELHLDAVARRFNMRVHRLPHFGLARHLKLSLYAPQWSSLAHRMRTTTFFDVESRAKKMTALPLVADGPALPPIEWVAWGWRSTDGPHRHGLLAQYEKNFESGIFGLRKRCFPIWRWHDAEVYAFLRSRKVPLPHRFGAARGSGVDLEPDVLIEIRALFPRDYVRILEVFPHAETIVHREDIRRARGDGAARDLGARERAARQAHPTPELPAGADPSS